MIDIVNLDLVPTEYIDEKLYYLPESDINNINFYAVGIESHYFIENTGSVLWTIYAYLLLAIISICLYKVKFIWKHFGSKFYWNSQIRLYISLY